VAIDGKTIRAACEKVYHKKVPMLINALMVDTGIRIGQLRVDAKTNEIKGIPNLLQLSPQTPSDARRILPKFFLAKAQTLFCR